MSLFVTYFWLSAPLFALVLAGYVLACWRRWRREWTTTASQFVFAFALPAMLFHLMSKLHELPPVDARLLIAFFGGCLLVFFIGRAIGARIFHLEGPAQSIFALGGVFSNNVLLGVPLARLTLGETAIPAVALVLVFNALTLWTLLSVSVEWSRHGSFSLEGFSRTARAILKNPIVMAILAGTVLGLSRYDLPASIDVVLDVIGKLAAPAALLVLGMGLVDYGLRHEWQQSLAICALKLIVQPLAVWALAAALGLPPIEQSAVVLLASLAVGANVYLMSVQYETLQGTVASSLVLSTALAAITTPLFLALLKATAS
jgi:malonate transporter and related proteins